MTEKIKKYQKAFRKTETLKVIKDLFSFLSAFVYSMLSKKDTTLLNYLPHSIIISMINNKIHFMMYISFLLMSIMVIFLIINNGTNESFASELDEITETIKTPKSVGQSQHGSARWLKPNEYDKIFSSYDVTSENKLIEDLVEGGLIDKGQLKVKKDLLNLKNK